MSQRACLRLEPFEREYLRKYNILPHNHYKQLIAQGVSSAQASNFINNRITEILIVKALEDKALKQKQLQDEYLELAKQNPFLVT